jgi:hypothetical protein
VARRAHFTVLVVRSEQRHEATHSLYLFDHLAAAAEANQSASPNPVAKPAKLPLLRRQNHPRGGASL